MHLVGSADFPQLCSYLTRRNRERETERVRLTDCGRVLDLQQREVVISSGNYRSLPSLRESFHVAHVKAACGSFRSFTKTPRDTRGASSNVITQLPDVRNVEETTKPLSTALLPPVPAAHPTCACVSRFHPLSAVLFNDTFVTWTGRREPETVITMAQGRARARLKITPPRYYNYWSWRVRPGRKRSINPDW